MRSSVLAMMLTACGRLGFDPVDGSTPGAAECFPILSLGHQSTYGVDVDGRLWAWGDNYYGQLGVPNSEYENPFVVPNLPPVTMIAGGFVELAALEGNGTLHRLGFLAGNTPPPRLDTSGNWRTITAGNNVACGIKNDGTAWCWGYNDSGQLGNGTATGNEDQSFAPGQVGADTDWKQIAAGSSVTCGIRGSGTLYCWGANDFGQLGQGTTSVAVALPTPVPNTWLDVDVTEMGVVAIRSDRTLWGWGYGPETGGGYVAGPTPQQIGPDADWQSVHTQFRHVCARKLDDSVWCWGVAIDGALGALPESSLPQALEVRTSEIQVGGMHTCLRIAGAWQCFGGNSDGQLGTFDTEPRVAPTPLCR